MKFPNSEKKQVLKTNKALAYKLAETQLNEVVELTIEPGGEIKAHALDINVLFYVIFGLGEITIDNKTDSAKQGDIIEVKANSQRSWNNNSDQNIMLLVIKQKK